MLHKIHLTDRPVEWSVGLNRLNILHEYIIDQKDFNKQESIIKTIVQDF